MPFVSFVDKPLPKNVKLKKSGKSALYIEMGFGSCTLGEILGLWKLMKNQKN